MNKLIIESNFKCPLSTFYCSKDHNCISHVDVCDGTLDCKHGEDEENCLEIKKFNCFTNKQTIPFHLVCNFNNDCTDGSDEINCGTYCFPYIIKKSINAVVAIFFFIISKVLLQRK